MSDISLLNQLFTSGEKYTFLIGAGISMNAPSSLPSAPHIVEKLIELFTPHQEKDRILNLEGLRYELAVEIIKKYVDPELKFMNYFELLDQPNIIDYFLAHAIKAGNYVITTNFDYLIEHALIKITQDKSRIIPIITKLDYLNHSDPQDIFNSGKLAIYKIHGSKKNIITGESTQESLITTISAFGKGREGGETFAIEAYKKPVIKNLMNERILVVMGYSGNDDFDIGPTLQELHGIRRLIWLNHKNTGKIGFIQFKDTSSLKNDNLGKVDELLLEVLKHSKQINRKIEIFRIDVNTTDFIEKVLWPEILKNTERPVLPSTIEGKIDFHKWISSVQFNIDEFKKCHVAHDIFNYLSYFNDALRCAKNGWKIAKKQKDLTEKALFHTDLGSNYKALKNYNKALREYRRALRISKKIKNSRLLANSLANIGELELLIKLSKDRNKNKNIYGLWNRVMIRYSKALKIARDLKDFDLSVSLIKRIGETFHEKARFYGSFTFKRKKAELAYQSALKWYDITLNLENQLGNLIGKAIILQKIGAIYTEKKEQKLASEKLEEALKIADELGDLSLKRDILIKISDFDGTKKDYRSAFRKKQEALKLEEKIGLDQKQTKAELSRLKLQIWFNTKYGKIEKAILYFIWIIVGFICVIPYMTYTMQYSFIFPVLIGLGISALVHIVIKTIDFFDKENKTEDE